jgi:hypothetical protein
MLVYPVAESQSFPNNINLPESETHVFRSATFFWSRDSNSVVFADSVQDLLSVALISFEDGAFRTFFRHVALDEVCRSSPDDTKKAHWILSDVDISGRTGTDTEIHLYWKAPQSACQPTPITLTLKEFRPATPEKPERLPSPKPSVEVK